jgi:hypothetical protein
MSDLKEDEGVWQCIKCGREGCKYCLPEDIEKACKDCRDDDEDEEEDEA